MFKNIDTNGIYCNGCKHRSIKTFALQGWLPLGKEGGKKESRPNSCSSTSEKLYSLRKKEKEKKGRKWGGRKMSIYSIQVMDTKGFVDTLYPLHMFEIIIKT